MSVQNNPIFPPIIRLKNNREPIDAILLDNEGNVIDLTGKTIVCDWYDVASETQIVTGGACTLTDAEAGKVRYTPAAGDVDAIGLFAVYFRDSSVSPNRLYPYDGARYTVKVVDAWETQ